MDITKISETFKKEEELLIDSGIHSIYLYGSQIPIINKIKKIPTGREVDILFIKKGYLKDGFPPIQPEIIKNSFFKSSNIQFTYNGVWNDYIFEENKYYFDISGNGLENIQCLSASTKVSYLKPKILIWGIDIYSKLSDVSLSITDKIELLNTMSNYVKREFYGVYTKNNLHSIYKNALFLVSLYDNNLLFLTDKKALELEIYKSDIINKEIKNIIEMISNHYVNSNFIGLKQEFNNLIMRINYE